jgi:hypothetical protein
MERGVPMSRYIDADALKPDYVVGSTSTGTECYRYVSLNQIMNTPTADVAEVPRWISVTERLPKESDGKVLITVSGEVETGKYSEFSKTWFIGVLNGVSGDAPIAWMPLPEPWNGRERCLCRLQSPCEICQEFDCDGCEFKSV